MGKLIALFSHLDLQDLHIEPNESLGVKIYFGETLLSFYEKDNSYYFKSETLHENVIRKIFKDNLIEYEKVNEDFSTSTYRLTSFFP